MCYNFVEKCCKNFVLKGFKKFTEKSLNSYFSKVVDGQPEMLLKKVSCRDL